MADKCTQAKLKIEYRHYHDADSVQIDTTITVDGDEWTVDCAALSPNTFQVVETRDEIRVAPVTDGSADISRLTRYGSGRRIEPQSTKHNDNSVKAIVGDAVAETLGSLVADETERAVSENGIKPASAFSLPDIELEVKRKFVQPRGADNQSRRVVAPVETDSRFSQWKNAICDASKQQQLLAPLGFHSGERLTLAEFIDGIPLIDPEAVVEAHTTLDDIKRAKRQERRETNRKEELQSSHPELRGVTISNLDAFEEAEQTGETVEIAETSRRCRDQNAECNLDLVTFYATPDGQLEQSTSHTF